LGLKGSNGRNVKTRIMKKLVGSVICTVCIISSGFAQRDFTPGKRRSDVFGGAADFKEYRPFGLQISAGPTFMLTRRFPITKQIETPFRDYEITTKPNGLPGVFVEVGMLHFPGKRSKLSQRLKYIFVSYIDWGIGFKLLGGEEYSKITTLDPTTGAALGSVDQTGKFYNGFVSGRVTLHKNFYLGKKYFIDNGLGLNFDYNVMRAPEATPYTATMLSVGQPHRFHHPFVAQMHYELGFGIRLNRRSMLIPSAQVPILGFHEWRGGASALKWFDSNYLPLLVKIKWTYLFEKKVKGCAPARVNDQDRDTMNKN